MTKIFYENTSVLIFYKAVLYYFHSQGEYQHLKQYKNGSYVIYLSVLCFLWEMPFQKYSTNNQKLDMKTCLSARDT